MCIVSPVLGSLGAKTWRLGGFCRRAVDASAFIRSAVKSGQSYPAVGDWVALRSLGEPSRAIIEAVLPRKSQFIRNAAGKQTEAQVVAANMDWVFVMMSLNQDFNVRRLQRSL